MSNDFLQPAGSFFSCAISSLMLFPVNDGIPLCPLDELAESLVGYALLFSGLIYEEFEISAIKIQ